MESERLRFGPFVLFPSSGELCRNGRRVALRPQAIKVLHYLASRSGRVVSRDELNRQLWDEGTYVDFSHGLTLCIYEIRAALHDDSSNPIYVETLPRKGYRFVGTIENESSATAGECLNVKNAGPSAALSAGPQNPAFTDSRMDGTLHRSRAFSRLLAVLGMVAAAGGIILVTSRPAAQQAVAASPAAAIAPWWAHARGERLLIAGSPKAVRGARRATLAVLPFENRGPATDANLATGITDDVRDKLAALQQLAVTGGVSSNDYMGTRKSLQEIARELGVDFLLAAAVHREKPGPDSRITVAAELVEAGRDRAVVRWRETFQTGDTDVFDVQTQIATQVAEELEISLSPSESARLAEKPTTKMAAYEAYLRGRQLRAGGWGPTVCRQAITSIEEAVALDPRFADAWAELAHARAVLYDYAPSAEGAENVRTAAETAIAVGPHVPSAHLVLGMYHLKVQQDEAVAAATYRRALELFPDNCGLLMALAQLEREAGNYDVALHLFRRAVAVEPRSWGPRSMLAAALIFARRPAEARAEAERGLALNPLQDYMIFEKTMTHLQEGDLAAARRASAMIPESSAPRAIGSWLWMYPANSWVLDGRQRDLVLRLGPGVFNDNRGRWGDALATEQWLRGNRSEARRWAEEGRKGYEAQLLAGDDDALIHGGLARVLAVLGRKAEAEREAERAIERAVSARGVRLGWVLEAVAVAYVRTGNQERAIDTLQRLLTVPHATTREWLRVDPNHASLQSQPRFRRLIGL
jgi:DNA-binding winged helix-turn-helix (wHTH) protein/TolB-like protein/tetratricopeptide (TPR) repeat protein